MESVIERGDGRPGGCLNESKNFEKNHILIEYTLHVAITNKITMYTIQANNSPAAHLKRLTFADVGRLLTLTIADAPSQCCMCVVAMICNYTYTEY